MSDVVLGPPPIHAPGRHRAPVVVDPAPAFGLTMLRLWVVGAAVWMALVLAMAVVRNASSRSDRSWLVAGAGAAAVALVLVADVVGPEGFVARHNIDRAGDGAALDVAYLARLSDDAVPAIAEAIDEVDDPWVRAQLLAGLRCDVDREGAAALNVSAARAAEVRADLQPEIASTVGPAYCPRP